MEVEKLEQLNLTVKYAQENPVKNTLTQMLVPGYFINKFSKHDKTMLELQNTLSIVDPECNDQITVPSLADNEETNAKQASLALQNYTQNIWLRLKKAMQDAETENNNQKANSVKRIKTLLNKLARENELSSRIIIAQANDLHVELCSFSFMRWLH